MRTRALVCLPVLVLFALACESATPRETSSMLVTSADSDGPAPDAPEGCVTLRDPDGKIPFAIVNHFTSERELTEADFVATAVDVDGDGALLVHDALGPSIVRADASGKVLASPAPVMTDGGVSLATTSPTLEEGTAVRIMNAFAAHARAHGGRRTPVFSPWNVMFDDGDATQVTGTRETVPAGAGLATASSKIFDLAALHAAGFSVVPWTVDDAPRIAALLTLGVDGIISDRPDLLYAAVAAHDADGDGRPGDWLEADGLIDPTRFDAQGHRGGRDLRPENTLPAFEVALDWGMNTLEFDIGITKDGVPVVSHDPFIAAQKCRLANGQSYDAAEEKLISSVTLAELQSSFVCDKLFRGPDQKNDLALSPVATAFTTVEGASSPYVMPTLDQVFRFVDAYAAYYEMGAGASHPDAAKRAKAARRVRFNVETKINPRAEFASRTTSPKGFVDTILGRVAQGGLEARVDLQSFDFRSLVYAQETFPAVRTVYLFGDFPVFADRSLPGSDDGTNMQPDEGGANTPWMAGLDWPYRQTRLGRDVRAPEAAPGRASAPLRVCAPRARR